MNPIVLQLLEINVVATPIFDGEFKFKFEYDNAELIAKGVAEKKLQKEIQRVIKEINDS